MLIFVLFGEQLLRLFTDQIPLIVQAKPYLLWIIVAPVINVACLHLGRYFSGCDRFQGTAEFCRAVNRTLSDCCLLADAVWQSRVMVCVDRDFWSPEAYP